MMIFTAKLTKKKVALCVVFAGLCIGLVILLLGLKNNDSAAAPDFPSPVGITDNDDRLAYLKAYGWEVSEEPVETLRLVLPKTIEGSWISYNDLQLQQGFDLTPYCGQKAERFTYAVTNYPNIPEGVQVNLYLCNDTVVAGDIFCTGENGFQAALCFPDGQESTAAVPSADGKDGTAPESDVPSSL